MFSKETEVQSRWRHKKHMLLNNTFDYKHYDSLGHTTGIIQGEKHCWNS
jgi:hypothetical protein